MNYEWIWTGSFGYFSHASFNDDHHAFTVVVWKIVKFYAERIAAAAADACGEIWAPYSCEFLEISANYVYSIVVNEIAKGSSGYWRGVEAQSVGFEIGEMPFKQLIL